MTAREDDRLAARAYAERDADSFIKKRAGRDTESEAAIWHAFIIEYAGGAFLAGVAHGRKAERDEILGRLTLDNIAKDLRAAGDESKPGGGEG